MHGTPREVFSHGEELEAMGLGVPQMTRVVPRPARPWAWPVDPAVYTVEQAKAALLRLAGRKGGE